MAKNKGTRIVITLKCMDCKANSGNSRTKISYTTTKNRRNTPGRLELKKFCPRCNSHTYQKEVK